MRKWRPWECKEHAQITQLNGRTRNGIQDCEVHGVVLILASTWLCVTAIRMHAWSPLCDCVFMIQAWAHANLGISNIALANGIHSLNACWEELHSSVPTKFCVPLGQKWFIFCILCVFAFSICWMNGWRWGQRRLTSSAVFSYRLSDFVKVSIWDQPLRYSGEILGSI